MSASLRQYLIVDLGLDEAIVASVPDSSLGEFYNQVFTEGTGRDATTLECTEIGADS
jgi:hypothetical protein